MSQEVEIKTQCDQVLSIVLPHTGSRSPPIYPMASKTGNVPYVMSCPAMKSITKVTNIATTGIFQPGVLLRGFIGVPT